MERPVGEEAKSRIVNRLRRIEGQARGIQKMVAEGKNCTEIIVQLSALQAAVQKVSKVVLGNYLECAIEEEMAREGDYREAVRKAVEILVRARL